MKSPKLVVSEKEYHQTAFMVVNFQKSFNRYHKSIWPRFIRDRFSTSNFVVFNRPKIILVNLLWAWGGFIFFILDIIHHDLNLIDLRSVEKSYWYKKGCGGLEITQIFFSRNSWDQVRCERSNGRDRELHLQRPKACTFPGQVGPHMLRFDAVTVL